MNNNVLYSYRRCPYAMRARMALKYSGIEYEIREISFKNKPSHMLQISPKGTVPVFQLSTGEVIDESIDIMYWALKQSDPNGWLKYDIGNIIEQNDGEFKHNLDRFKYPDRYNDLEDKDYKLEALKFINRLEKLLSNSSNSDPKNSSPQTFLFGPNISIADIAIFPFVRQFSKVDEKWFSELKTPFLKSWLQYHINSELFISIMQKHQVWI